jgi:hypothetical protein
MGAREIEKEKSSSESLWAEISMHKLKFEVYGEEMICREVKKNGNYGRVYLRPDWIGKNLKIIRMD